MKSAPRELHEAIFKTLAASTELVAKLGGPKIFDRVPERVSLPYIVLGQMSVADWSTSTEDGDIVTFTLHSWSKGLDRAESHEIQTLVKGALENMASLQDNALIHIRTIFSEIRRDVTSRHLHGIMRFRAVLEPNI